MLPQPKKFKLLIFIFVSVYVLYSCDRSAVVAPTTTGDPLRALNLPPTPFNYANQPLPHFFHSQLIAEQDNTPSTNPVTDWGATLGRVLFYDKILSINNSIACGSCHKQSLSITRLVKSILLVCDGCCFPGADNFKRA